MINIKLEQFKTDLNKLFEKVNCSKNIFDLHKATPSHEAPLTVEDRMGLPRF